MWCLMTVRDAYDYHSIINLLWRNSEIKVNFNFEQMNLLFVILRLQIIIIQISTQYTIIL